MADVPEDEILRQLDNISRYLSGLNVRAQFDATAASLGDIRQILGALTAGLQAAKEQLSILSAKQDTYMSQHSISHAALDSRVQELGRTMASDIAAERKRIDVTEMRLDRAATRRSTWQKIVAGAIALLSAASGYITALWQSLPQGGHH